MNHVLLLIIIIALYGIVCSIDYEAEMATAAMRAEHARQFDGQRNEGVCK